MANYVTQFLPNEEIFYPDGYVSKILEPQPAEQAVQQARGVFQVAINTGAVILQGRLAQDAPWFDLKEYTSSAMEEMVLPNQMRIIATGLAKAWLGEVR